MVTESKDVLENEQQAKKLINECYCCSMAENLKSRSKKTIDNTSLLCTCCKSTLDTIDDNLLARVNTIKNVRGSTLPPFNCETFKRVQKISYVPQSEFLRRVQKKISSHKTKTTCSCSELSTTSATHQQWGGIPHDSCKGLPPTRVCFHGGNNIFGRRLEGSERRLRSETRTNHDIQFLTDDRRSIMAYDAPRGRCASRRMAVAPRQPHRSKSISSNDRSVMKIEEKNDARKDLGLTRKSRSCMKKVIRSSECLKDQQRRFERPPLKHLSKNKKIVRTISGFNRCCGNDEPDDNSKNLDAPRTRKESRRKNNLLDPEERDETWLLEQIKSDIVEPPLHDIDKNFNDLNEFRQQNYFDTHGSAHTLFTSSSSTESPDRSYSNDRIFQEPVRKDYHKNCTKTVTPCATKNRKRIQNCPKYIAKQEKGINNCNYGKKMPSKNVGLSGHLLDLGIVRIPCHVSNTFTIKYQKPLVIRNL